MDLALEKSRIKFPKKFQEISRKTLKMDEDILKDIHILKLNILGCDSLLAPFHKTSHFRIQKLSHKTSHSNLFGKRM